MNILKEKIIEANKAYRDGTPTISDEEYDVLLSRLEKEMNPIEYISFKETLFEDGGDVKHKYIIGSLEKVKYGENQLDKFIKANRIGSLIASEKLDGCSFTAEYHYGKFISGATRGDGITGKDISNKLKYILPQIIETKKEVLSIRGELVLTNNSHTELGFKNRRNGVVGIINRDEIRMETITHVKAFVYQILNSKDGMFAQLSELDFLGFETPRYCLFNVDENIEDSLKDYFVKNKNKAVYDMDGLVISDIDCENENAYHPKTKVAFKVNSEGVHVKVIDIEWNTSKTGAVKPVVLIEPTEIDGVTVKRVTGYNAQYIHDNKINKDAIVSLVRSGEVIPKIINVIQKSDTSFVDLLTECPCCKAKLQWHGVDLRCTNSQCGDMNVKKIASFLRDCGVENITETSLINWGINTFDDLLKFESSSSSKAKTSFLESLNKNIFTKTDDELFANMSFDGAGTTNINKIIDFYGRDDANTIIYNDIEPAKFPEGIGMKTLRKIKEDWRINRIIVGKICNDKRYNVQKKETFTNNEQGEIMNNISGKSFLLTGTMTEKRSVVETEIKSFGGTIASSVTAKLDYLICAPDSWGSSSKYTKAQKLGVKIITEAEYRGLII